VPENAHRTGLGGVAVVGAVAYALGAAATTPFTLAADVMTALPIALALVVAIARWPARPDRSTVLDAEQSRHPYVGWVVLFAAVVGWELVEYLVRGSRAAHPTLSSMLDAFNRHYVAKSFSFFVWLCLGAAIVRAGALAAPRRRRARPGATPRP
jgi:hypothetical protein